MSKDPARQIAESARTFADPAEREAYLERVCRGIARLRADVDRHLAEMDAGGGAGPEPEPAAQDDEPAVMQPIASPVKASDADAADSASVDVGSEKAGDRIGRFLLVKELGEGGFGTVWKAEQVEPVRRTVALKIIKLGMDTEQVVARFEQERQALALMDHPHVARVIDAGATRTGRPYFVMDLVQGVPIGEFCDAERLAVEARLALFVQVCGAVQHAHMKGIIHRDLKPSNVLVAMRDGVPHATVIDFGIAKATSAKLTDRSLVTEAYQVIGTLQYMSPEQSQASPDIDTRTDVYSLGIILYELLTGTTPYDADTLQRAVLSDILRMIGEADAPPPSAKITQTREALPALADSRSIDVRRLASTLRGELDWIVLKSIEKDRARRYESAEAFASDIRRFLSGEEVSAAPPSAAYRLRKLVRRNKGPVAAAAAVAAALVAGIVGFAWQAGVAERERDDAIKARKAEEAERKRAAAVAEFMQMTFKGLDPTADEATSGSLKERLIARIEEMSSQFSKLDADPLGRAAIEATFADTMGGLGEYEKSLAAYRSAHALRAAALGESAKDTEQTELAIAFISNHVGKHDEALRIATELRDRRTARGGPTEEEWIELDELFGIALSAAGRSAEATPHVEALCRRLQAKGGPDTRELLFALHTLGVSYRECGRPADAVRVLTDVYARRAALLGPASTDTLFTGNSLAVALSSAGRSAESVKLLTELRDQIAIRYAPDHPMSLHANNNLAGALSELGRVDDAVKLIEEQSARAKARYGPETPTYLQTRWALAAIYDKAGRNRESFKVIDEIVAPMSRVWGPEHETVRRAREGFMSGALDAGKADRALAFLESEITRASALPAGGGADGVAAVRLRAERGLLLVLAGRTQEGLAQLEALVPLMESFLGARDATYLRMLHEIGTVYFQAGDAKAALAAIERAWKAKTAALGPDARSTLSSHHVFGSANWLAQDFPRAVEILTEVLARSERALGRDDPDTLATALDLAVNLLEAGRKDEYFAHCAAWLPRVHAVLGCEHGFAVQVTEMFANACVETERHADAAWSMEFLADAAQGALGPEDPQALRLRGNAAACWWRAGRLDKSLPMFEDLVPRVRKASGASSPQALQLAGNLGVNLRDAKRIPEALAILEETLRDARAAGPPAAQIAQFTASEYARTLAMADRKAEAKALIEECLAAARKRAPGGGAALASELGGIVPGMLEAGFFAEAEPVLRELVAIRERAAPGLWNHWNARALLGEALMGLGRHAEAEAFVVSGYVGLAEREKGIPQAARHWLPKARERVLRLYAALDAAEPGKGYDATLAEWKTKLGK